MFAGRMGDSWRRILCFCCMRYVHIRLTIARMRIACVFWHVVLSVCYTCTLWPWLNIAPCFIQQCTYTNQSIDVCNISSLQACFLYAFFLVLGCACMSWPHKLRHVSVRTYSADTNMRLQAEESMHWWHFVCVREREREREREFGHLFLTSCSELIWGILE